MTARELISLNQMITDIEMEIRRDGTRLLDCMLIGPAIGIVPRFPRTVPKTYELANDICATMDKQRRKQAIYNTKSINSMDDGKGYWQVKLERIPKKWLELTVFSWEVWPASTVGCPHRHGTASWHGQRLNIVLLPAGEDVRIQEDKPKPAQDDQIEGQIDIFDFIGGAP